METVFNPSGVDVKIEEVTYKVMDTSEITITYGGQNIGWTYNLSSFVPSGYKAIGICGYSFENVNDPNGALLLKIPTSRNGNYDYFEAVVAKSGNTVRSTGRTYDTDLDEFIYYYIFKAKLVCVPEGWTPS